MSGCIVQVARQNSMIDPRSKILFKQSKTMANGGERPISEFEDILRLIRPFGRWQITACILAAFTGMFTSFFVLIHSFVGTKIPHYCRVPALSAIPDAVLGGNTTLDNPSILSASSWTLLERREFSIPPKVRAQPPAVGQPFQPCLYFEIDYMQYVQLPYDTAWLKRVLTDPAPIVESCRNGWEFNTTDSQYPSSIQMEWNLTCKHSYLLALSQSLFMVGFLFGVLLSGALSDAYGRKRILAYAAATGVLFSFLTAAAPTYSLYVLSRFICAFCLASAYTIGFVLCMEIIGPAHRSLVGFAYQLPWTCGYIILPCAAYVVQNWRWLYVVLAAPSCLMLTYHWLLPESPRWLILRGFVIEARCELQRAAKRNGVVLPSKLPLYGMHRQQVAQQQREDNNRLKLLRRRRHARNRVTTVSPKPSALAENSTSRDNFLSAENGTAHRARAEDGMVQHPSGDDLQSPHNGLSEVAVIGNETPRSNSAPLHALGLRRQFWFMWNGLASLFTYRRTRKRTFIQYFCWFVNAIVYYGLAFYSTRLEGHLYLNFFLGGAVEVPAYVVGYFTYKHFGRRLPLLISMLLSGGACLGVATMSICDVMQKFPMTTLALSTFGKFCITASFGMIYIYTSELFPTMLRNVGLGSCSTMARVGSAVAPFVLRAGDTIWHPLPMLVFGSLSILSGISVLFLPETWHAQLPETVEAAENFGRGDRNMEAVENDDHNFSFQQRNNASACKSLASGQWPLTIGSPVTVPDDADDADNDEKEFLDEVRSGAAMPSPNAVQQNEFLKSNPAKQLQQLPAALSSIHLGDESRKIRSEWRSGACMPSPDILQQSEFDFCKKQSANANKHVALAAPRQHHPRSSIFSPHVPFARFTNNVRNPNAADKEEAVRRRLSKAFVNAATTNRKNSMTTSSSEEKNVFGQKEQKALLAVCAPQRHQQAKAADSIERSFTVVAEQPKPKLIGKMQKILPTIKIIEASGSVIHLPTAVSSDEVGKRSSRNVAVGDTVDYEGKESSARPVSWSIYQDSSPESGD